MCHNYSFDLSPAWRMRLVGRAANGGANEKSLIRFLAREAVGNTIAGIVVGGAPANSMNAGTVRISYKGMITFTATQLLLD
jgi:hypothetical protein